jgi:hypothetical protein
MSFFSLRFEVSERLESVLSIPPRDTQLEARWAKVPLSDPDTAAIA